MLDAGEYFCIVMWLKNIQSCFNVVVIIVCLASQSLAISGDDINVPDKLVIKLDSLFPQVTGVIWSKVRRTFRADFNYRDYVYSITFDKTGEIVNYREETDLELLPATAKIELKRRFAGFKTLIVIKQNKKGRMTFEVEVMKGNFHYILNFNSLGFLDREFFVDKLDTNRFMREW